MGDALRFTIHYSDGGEGWIKAQVEEVPGAISQGRTRPQARENVIDALRLMLKPEPDQTPIPTASRSISHWRLEAPRAGATSAGTRLSRGEWQAR